MQQLSLKNDFVYKTKPYSNVQTNQAIEFSNVLPGVAKGDRIAIEDCINNYGKFIWGLAKKFTDSTKDAEALTEEIFRAIWCYAERFEQTDCDELLFVTLIACRQVRKYLENSNQSIKILSPSQIKE